MKLNWKTIDKLNAIVPGANTYRGERCEFDVRFGRPGTPLSLTEAAEYRFRIENKELDIAVEAATLGEAKQLLRDRLAASENFSGTWKLLMHVEVAGGYEPESSFGKESAECSIATRFILELTTHSNGRRRIRHMSLRQALPQPFTGEFWKPKTHNELSDLREQSYRDSRKGLISRGKDDDEVIVEATPELVELVRSLQRRLGDSGDRVKTALSKKQFSETLDRIRAGGTLLLDTNLTK